MRELLALLGNDLSGIGWATIPPRPRKAEVSKLVLREEGALAELDAGRDG